VSVPRRVPRNRRGIAWSPDGKVNYVVPLDPGIAEIVEALRARGVETCESCQGGTGHAFAEPTVCFYGDRAEGLRALGTCVHLHLPVNELRRVWQIIDGEPSGPTWALTFRL
jgi:hypothetical protein